MIAETVTLAAGLALAASVGYGVSDVLSGVVVRRHTAASVAWWAQLTGLVVLGVAVGIRRPELSIPGVLWGAAAGVLGALAVLAFYTALQNGRTAIVAPVAGCGVLVPLVVGLATGREPLGPVVIVGLVAAIAGTLTVAVASGDDRGAAEEQTPRQPSATTPGRSQPVPVHDGCRPFAFRRPTRTSVLMALVAATGFGTFFVVLEQATASTASDSAERGLDAVLLVALAVQVGAFAVTAVAATGHSLACLRPTRSLVVPAGSIGLIDVGADLVLTAAVSVGPLALVGPLGSLDPVITMVIATGLLRERINRWQTGGIALALIGITLVSL